MFLILTGLTALISIMFVASVLTAVSEMHRENKTLKSLNGHDRVF